MKDGQAYVQKGIEKYKFGVFRVPYVDKWAVVLNKPEMIDEIRKASEQDVSVHDAINEVGISVVIRPSSSESPLRTRLCKENILLVVNSST